MLGHRPLEQLEIKPGDVLHDVDHGVVGDSVEEHVGIAQ